MEHSSRRFRARRSGYGCPAPPPSRVPFPPEPASRTVKVPQIAGAGMPLLPARRPLHERRPPTLIPIFVIPRPHPAPASPGDPTLSPTTDQPPHGPDAPEDRPTRILPPDLLAAATTAFARVPPPLAPAQAPAKDRGEALCVTCGLSLPATETECAFCTHARAAGSNSTAQLLRHWLVFLAVMLAVFGAGWIVAP